ncbi:MAG: Gfo/Idh/MocA family oxidoreductase [Acidobacteria bacterium]|nr:Gfo/Idh/MocA family oxidoreductase [Acidobacteriota bacterium]
MKLQRRDFMLASAAVGGVARAQTAERIATAVIGTGNRGSYLLSGVLEQPEAKVAAVCDIKPDRLDKAASAAAKDSPATYNDWRRVIDRKDIGAVFIATPPHLHAEMAMAALAAGKHVYCEKPVGVTAAQVGALVKAAKGAKTVFVSGQQLRSGKQLGEAVRRIREGAIGDVMWVKAQRHATADLPHDGTSGDWYFDVAKSGGYLIEQSVHNLDACNWVIGSRPVRACGFGGTQLYKNDPPGRTIFDCASLTYEYQNGVKLSFTQNVFHPRTMPSGGQYIHVYGTKGAVDLMSTATLYPLGKEGQPSVLAEKREESRHAHIMAFYEAITKGTPVPAGIEVGATAALTAILGHEAMVRQTVVNWSDLGVEV